MTENSDQHIINKAYKEIDILYGSEVKNNTNIEFRYTEPKKLQDIERFFIEFFISIRSNNDIFYDSNHELKYFDYSIITSINDILINHKQQVSNTVGFESLINKINNKLHENYQNMNSNGADQPQNESKNDEQLKIIELNKNDKEPNTSNFLLINKENILKELFKYKEIQSILNKSEFEIENIENKVYIKQKDGWMIRDRPDKELISNPVTGSQSVNNTILLSRMGSVNNVHIEKDIKDKNDLSLDFSKKFSIINPGVEDSIIFNNKINKNLKNVNTSQTLDNIIQDLDYTEGQNKLIIKENERLTTNNHVMNTGDSPIVSKKSLAVTEFEKQIVKQNSAARLKIYDENENQNKSILNSNLLNSNHNNNQHLLQQNQNTVNFRSSKSQTVLNPVFNPAISSNLNKADIIRVTNVKEKDESPLNTRKNSDNLIEKKNNFFSKKLSLKTITMQTDDNLLSKNQ